MSDFSFLKTGFDPLQNESANLDLDFLRKMTSISKILMKEAMDSAFRVAQCCGREEANEYDMVLALKYETHHFFKKNIDDEFFEIYNEELNHTYTTESDYTSDEEEGEEGEEEEGEEEEEEEEEGEEEEGEILCDSKTCANNNEHIFECKECDDIFFNEIKQIQQNWQNFSPTDPIISIMKNAADKAENMLPEPIIFKE